MWNDALKSYDAAAKTTASSRELEAAALFKAARLLESCRQEWDAPDRDSRLQEALRHNQRLWSFFQGELSNPDHPMAPDVRVNLLRLSAFVDRRTFELLSHPEPDKLQALIEINRSIASGLATRRPEGGPG